MSNLAKRLLTGLVGAAIMIGAMSSGTYGHVAIFALITVMSLYELLAMYSKLEEFSFQTNLLDIITFVGFGLIGYLIFTAVLLGYASPISLLGLVPLLLITFIIELYRKRGSAFVNVGSICLGLLYIALPLAMANKLSHPDGSFYIWYTLMAMAIVWVHDVFAYFVGRTFGKNALFKRISPNKTWEGTIGGLLGVLLTISALALSTGRFSPKTWIICGIIGALGATFGDLFESLLKRSVGVKDSSNVLPGHGGFLDRFDALFFVFPLILVVLLLLEGELISF